MVTFDREVPALVWTSDSKSGTTTALLVGTAKGECGKLFRQCTTLVSTPQFPCSHAVAKYMYSWNSDIDLSEAAYILHTV
jgi:hypothetical protein